MENSNQGKRSGSQISLFLTEPVLIQRTVDQFRAIDFWVTMCREEMKFPRRAPSALHVARSSMMFTVQTLPVSTCSAFSAPHEREILTAKVGGRGKLYVKR